MRLLAALASVMSSHTLAASTLLLAVAVAVIAAIAAAAVMAAALLFVPGAQWLAAKREVFILDDDGLHPGLGVELELAGGEVVVCCFGLFGRHCGRVCV